MQIGDSEIGSIYGPVYVRFWTWLYLWRVRWATPDLAVFMAVRWTILALAVFTDKLIIDSGLGSIYGHVEATLDMEVLMGSQMSDSKCGSTYRKLDERFGTWQFLRTCILAILYMAVFADSQLGDSAIGGIYGQVDVRPWNWQYLRSDRWAILYKIVYTAGRCSILYVAVFTDKLMGDPGRVSTYGHLDG